LQQPVRPFRLFGGAPDHAPHQKELRIMAAMPFGVDRFHVDIPLSASRDARSRSTFAVSQSEPKCAASVCNFWASSVAHFIARRRSLGGSRSCAFRQWRHRFCKSYQRCSHAIMCRYAPRIGKKIMLKRVLVGLVLICGAPAVALAEEPKMGGVI